ncbi:WD40/YVTN repeat-like domain containing protein [Pseudoloma neurophilia]|uniref:Elongator complex protein 2 n=1 Tax=Pseudoloma neurophilia TaxID=146866 RepID=A0A0R0LY58_9MICR|nr:WD40/YVTN repeat-like domain containing protein [Pseudoloma neurophilia]
MLKNVFNCAGIARSTHVLNTDGEKLFFPSSSNIIVYENEKMWPILRNGSDVKYLKIGCGIILCDTENRVEMNNRYVFNLKQPVTAINFDSSLKNKENKLQIFVFCTLSEIFLAINDKIYTFKLRDVAAIDIAQTENGMHEIFCGDLSGNLYKIVTNLDDLHFIEQKTTSQGKSFNDFLNSRYSKDLIKIEQTTKLEKYEINQIKCHDDAISSLKITRNFIITCSHDQTLKIIDRNDLTLLDTLLGHSDIVYDCFYDDKNNEILSASADNSIITWKFDKTWKNVNMIGNNSSMPFYSVVKLKNNTIYIQDYFGKLFKYENYKIVSSLSGHSDKITTCDMFDDLIITGSNDFSVKLFKNNMEIARPTLHGYPIQSAVFSSQKMASNNNECLSGDNTIIVGSEENILRVYEPTEAVFQYLKASSGDSLKRPVQFAMPSDLSLTNELHRKESVNFDENSNQKSDFSVPLNEHSLQNYLCYKEKKKLYGQYFSNSTVCTSGNNLILCTNKSANLKFSGIFVYYDFQLVQYIASHFLTITKMEFIGNFLFAVSRDRCISFYEIVNEFSEEKDCCSKDDFEAKMCHSNKESKIFLNKKIADSPFYLKFLYKSQIHTRAINSLSISPISHQIATCSKDKTVRILSSRNLEEEMKIECEEEPTAVRFIHKAIEDTSFLAIGTVSGSFLLYDAQNFKEIFKKSLHSRKITEIKYCNGKLVTVGEDWMMRVFELK